MNDEQSPILREVKKEIQVVPYTKRDRRITMAILLIAVANLLLMLLTLFLWGNVTV